MNGSESVVGMAGYFVSAMLQTAGFHSLSKMLLEGFALFSRMGYFIFLCFGLAALTTYALFGDTRRALYLLIGPVLFYWMLTPTVSYKYTAHQFGTRLVVESQARMQKTLSESTESTDITDVAYLPLFVAKYDQLVSSIVQRMVGLIADTENRADLRFVARERVLSRLLLASSDSPGFQSLLGQALLGACAAEMRLHSELGTDRLMKAVPGSAAAVEADLKKARLLQMSTQRHGLDASTAQFVQQNGVIPTDATCTEIWGYTKTAALAFAEKLLQPNDALRTEFALSPGEWQEVYDRVREKLVPEGASATDMNTAFRALAGIFLKNSVDNTVHRKLTGQLDSRSNHAGALRAQIFGSKTGYEGVGDQSTIAYFAAMVPYLQGMIIFLLSVSFPFFCIFLLMPTRVESFIIWIGLWAWVKSWDIGYAMVAVLRDILWQMIPRAGQFRHHEVFNSVDWDDPAAMFNFMYGADPTQSMSTYYMLVSVMTLAVPILTAQFFGGAVSLYQNLAGGFTSRADQVGTNEAKTSKARELTNLDAAINAKRYAAGKRSMEWARQNPGTAIGSDRRRDLLSDASFGRHMLAQGKIGIFDYFYSQQSQDDVRYRQMMENRRDINSGDISGYLLNAELNYLTEPNTTGRAPAEIFSGQNRDYRDLSFDLDKSPKSGTTNTDPLTGPAEIGGDGGGGNQGGGP